MKRSAPNGYAMLALFAALAICAPAVAQSPGSAPLRVTPADRGQLVFSYAPIVKRVTPAVVNVYASRVERRQANPLFDDPFFQRFFGSVRAGRRRVRSARRESLSRRATGGDEQPCHRRHDEVRVALSDRREFDAEIVLRDPRTDLAASHQGGGKLPAP